MDPTPDVLFATKPLISWKKVDFKAEGKLSTTKQKDRQKNKKELSGSTGITGLRQGPQVLHSRKEKLTSYVSTALSLQITEGF